MTETRDHPDLDLVEAIRSCCPEVPLAGTFDMHANLHPASRQLLTVGAGYRTHPHVDMRDLADRTLEHLVDCVQTGAATRCWLENTGLLLPSINMRTADGPMRRLQRPRRPGRSASRRAGRVGFRRVPLRGCPSQRRQRAGIYRSLAGRRRRLARQVAEGLVQVTARGARRILHQPALACRGPGAGLASGAAGLIGITDAADNPYSGGAADTPGLLPALLDASPEVPCVFASFADERTVGTGEAGRHRKPFDATTRRHPRQCLRRAGTSCAQSPSSSPRAATAARPGCWTVRTCNWATRCCWRWRSDPTSGSSSPAAWTPASTSRSTGCMASTSNASACSWSRERITSAPPPARLCAEIIDVDAPGPACLDFTRLPYRNRRVQGS